MDPGGAVGVNINEAKGLETTEPRSVKKQIPINPNSEVADGGGLAEAKPECARPRAQPLTSYQRWNIFQPPPIPRCCARGRVHSVYPNSKIAANRTAEPPRCEYFSA